MKSVTKIFFGSLAAACVLVTSIANAENVTYTINQQLSSIRLDVLVDARPTLPEPIDATTEQFPGSDIAIPTGTISAYREGDAQFGLIELLGSSFTYLNNSTPMAPATTNGTTEPAPRTPGGEYAPGQDPAQWGFITDLYSGIVGPTAMRNVQTSVTAGLQGMWEGGFDASTVSFNLLAAHNDQYYVGPGIPLFDVDPIDEWSGGDLPPGSAMNKAFDGQLTVDGDYEILYLPIDIELTTMVGSVPIALLFTGQIVAARLVPEPGTIAMAALGMIGLVTVGYRARKRNA